jgi:hypothetical protein
MSRGSRSRSRESPYDQMQRETGLRFDPGQTMARARSRPRDHSPAGPQSYRPDTEASKHGFPDQHNRYSRPNLKANVSHVQYIGPPSPRAASRQEATSESVSVS